MGSLRVVESNRITDEGEKRGDEQEKREEKGEGRKSYHQVKGMLFCVVKITSINGLILDGVS